MRDEKFPMGKIPDRRTEITYKAVIGGRLCTTRRSPILPEPIAVDVAVTEGRLSFLPGEVCKVAPDKRDKEKFPTGVIRVERQRLNLQKSASPIVPMKWLTTTEERGGR